MTRFVQQLTPMVFLICFAWNTHAAEPFCPKGSSPSPSVIWCDSFEDEDLAPNGTVGGNYFEFDTDNGDHARISTEHVHGQYALRARWQAGEVDAGHFIYNFGRNPLGSQSHNQQDFREIYWRFYAKLQAGFVGFPDKYTRATSFAGTNWQQAMIAHLWADSSARQFLMMDPASGINNQSQLVTTQWNDFNNLTWLGARRGTTALQAGRWYCIEAHVKLNNPGQSDGVFEFWIDNNLEARRADLNWVKSWTDYGINAVMFSDYWNAGSPQTQERYLDAVVISTQQIGCIGSRPNPPTNFKVQ
jgi:Polysaccharide lyase 14